MFQSVYDYPYLALLQTTSLILPLAMMNLRDLVDLGLRTYKKINLYNQYAQVLWDTGSTADGVKKFESDLSLDGAGAMKEVFINFSRLITKDQIKKGSFTLSLGTSSTYAAPFASRLVLQDALATDRSNARTTQGGDYGLLYGNSTGTVLGNVFYQAGIAVITTQSFILSLNQFCWRRCRRRVD